MAQLTVLDRQKTKLVVFFSALGLAGFLLNMLAGVGLWHYAGSERTQVPTYDRFVGELRHTSDAQLPALAKSVFEKWAACESKRSGMTTVAIHALITASVAGMAFFAICLALSWQVHQKIARLAGAGEPPQPPDPVDETWRGR